MPNRNEIYSDVAAIMKKRVVDGTNVDEEDYLSSIIPSKKPPAGFEASQYFWERILLRVAEDLREMDATYGKLKIEIADVKKTLNKEISFANKLIVEKILKSLS